MANPTTIISERQKFKKTPAGEIPVDWRAEQLGNLCVEGPEYGANVPGIEFREGLPRYIRITDVNDDGTLSPLEKKSINREEAQPYLLKLGDIIFARSGATVGKTYLYKTHDGSCAFAGYTIRFKPARQLLLSEFLFQFTHSNFYYQWVKNMLRAGAQPNINGSEYASLFLPLPSIQEQKKIVEILSAADDALDRARAVIEKTKELKKGLMQTLLTRGIGHKKFKKTPIGEIPEEWEIAPISGLCIINPSKTEIGHSENATKVSFIRMENIREDASGISEIQEGKLGNFINKGYTYFREGDLLFAKITPCMENGKVALARNLQGGIGFGSTEFHVLRPDPDEVSSQYLFYWISQKSFRELAARHFRGSAGQQRVQRDFFDDAFIPTPSLSEQKKIAEILTSVDLKIEKEEMACKILEEQKKALMQNLLSGKVRVLN